MSRHMSVLVCLLMAVGCGKKDDPAPESKEQPAAAAPASDHGGETALGKASLAGFDFEVAALGSVSAGNDAAIAVTVLKAPEGRDWRTINLYVWVEDAEGGKLSAAEKGRVEDERLHAHASVPASAKGVPAKVILRLRDGDVDERTSVSVGVSDKAGGKTDGPKHTHEKTPHDGILMPVRTAEGGPEVGWLELKLHDDKGDLELWLTQDKAGTKPMDIATNAAISVTFVDHAKRQVSLAPRNTEKNEDEDGNPNMRDGKTSYFIFPGKTGADAAWLMGKDFQSVVVVTVEVDGRKLRSDELVLKPHTHAADGTHNK